jgi:hypothetical protein
MAMQGFQDGSQLLRLFIIVAFGAGFFVDDVDADSADGMGTVTPDAVLGSRHTMLAGHEVIGQFPMTLAAELDYIFLFWRGIKIVFF